MTSRFAAGRRAKGTCDMCAGVYLLHELRPEIYNQAPTGFLVCSSCWDLDNPQLQLGKFPINDPQALRNPRVDTNLIQSRQLWGWSPVGNASTQSQVYAGFVSVNGQFQFPNTQENP
jgi:hypothetical protein